MALAVSSGRLIDRIGGRQDLASHNIRMVTPDIFRKDPVRLIRAYRLAAAFDFTIDAGTRKVLAQDANLISQAAGERVREEFFKIFQCAGSHAWLAEMAQSGVLFYVFPELRALNNDRIDGPGSESLFELTMRAYHRLEEISDPGGQRKNVPADALLQDIGTDRRILLKWAVLFHDLGVPRAQIPSVEKINDFSDPASKSAYMARKICRRLRFSKRQTDRIDQIIANHLEPYLIFQAHLRNIPYQKAFARFFMRCRNLTPAILLHALAVARAKKDSQDQGPGGFSNFIQALMREYYSVLQPRASRPPPLTGKDLIAEFGLKPSTEFKRILGRIEEEHLTNELLTRQQAIELVDKLINR
jgi:poly(A) polymerase